MGIDWFANAGRAPCDALVWQKRAMIRFLLSVMRYIDCAVQKVPPAMTPRAEIAVSEIINIKHPPHAFAQAPGEHSIPASSCTYVTGGCGTLRLEGMPFLLGGGGFKKTMENNSGPSSSLLISPCFFCHRSVK